MSHEHHAWRRFVMACAVAILIVAAAPPANAGLLAFEGPLASFDGGALQSDGPLGRSAHRLVHHVENSVRRLGTMFSTAGGLWLSLLASGLMFLLVVALSSALDVRMLSLRRMGPRTLSRYVGHGALTFIRILRDRRAPTIARAVLFSALVYWLAPRDLIPDNALVPGFIDDLLIAVVAAKAFVYLCPDSLVARHAAVVEARTQGRRSAPPMTSLAK
jgi:uncharacterized membrane protein YkvA (DUF1232 family)